MTDDTMKQYLTKHNRKTIDFVLIEADDKFVRNSEGKVGKSSVAISTLNAGSPDKAIEEVKLQIQQLIDRGFVITDLPKNLATEDIVFDKAKWHVNDDFPSDLDQHQSYIHSGLFICWLIENGLLEDDFKIENSKGINLLLSRQVAPSKFYVDYLDGVFDAEGFTEEAIKFTTDYFDFEKGNYLTDYLPTLGSTNSLPSLFHVADTWENYDKLKSIINKRFVEWKQADTKE
ncbi:MAG: hypothetical protein IPJ43_15580 [Saprospiraceae bacterium]|nr:hypothetical protein [Saprospiraceae bacterium]